MLVSMSCLFYVFWWYCLKRWVSWRLTLFNPVHVSIYFRIFNPDASGVGELVTRGRNVCMGYIWDEEKTRQERTTFCALPHEKHAKIREILCV
jgi:hypothetical protein